MFGEVVGKFSPGFTLGNRRLHRWRYWDGAGPPVRGLLSTGMAIEYRNALAAPMHLYHYEKFCADRLITTLRDQKIYCRNPVTLNDPWDCRPSYDPDLLKDPHEIDAYLEWIRTLSDEPPESCARADFEHLVRTDAQFRNGTVQGFEGLYYKAMDQFRIYCLTPNFCSTLMWSHYADSHRGICLEFRRDNLLFAGAQEIKYSEVYPKWLPHKSLDAAMDMYLTKSDEWKYEQEFRILAGSNFPDGSPLRLDGDYVKLPPGALVRILVGCKGDPGEVSKIAAQYAPGLPVRRMVQEPHHYRLMIEGEAEAAAI